MFLVPDSSVWFPNMEVPPIYAWFFFRFFVGGKYPSIEWMTGGYHHDFRKSSAKIFTKRSGGGFHGLPPRNVSVFQSFLGWMVFTDFKLSGVLGNLDLHPKSMNWMSQYPLYLSGDLWWSKLMWSKSYDRSIKHGGWCGCRFQEDLCKKTGMFFCHNEWQGTCSNGQQIRLTTCHKRGSKRQRGPASNHLVLREVWSKGPVNPNNQRVSQKTNLLLAIFSSI